jgi:hypothetical protein
MSNFNNYIKEISNIDNEITNYTSYINKLKKNRIKLENNLINIIKKNKYENKEFHYNNIKYTFLSTNSYSLSKKSINNCLINFFKNTEKANKLTEYIYANRISNTKEILKKTKIKK